MRTSRSIIDKELMELEINKRDLKSPVARYDTREWVKYRITREFPQECHGKVLKKRNKRWEQAEQGWYTCYRCINHTMIKSK